jgi:PAS domain S-box-containing protein
MKDISPEKLPGLNDSLPVNAFHLQYLPAIMNTNRSIFRRRFDSVVGRARRILESPVTAWGILAASLMLTLLAWHLSNQYLAKRTEDRFGYRVSQVKEQIEKRMLEYEQVLRGGVGLFEASSQVSNNEWKTYVENCEPQRYFPGIQAMGVSVPVLPEEKAAHEAELRSEGFPDYQIYPVGKRDFYTSIIYIEPFDWRNQRAFGYDMYSEPVRRMAMDRAIDSGLPTISGLITLVQETADDVQNGFLCYLPFYSRGAEVNTPRDRRAAFLGFVYAAFRVNDLMHGIMGIESDDIKFEIYDAQDTAPDRLLFDSDQLSHFDPQSSQSTYSCKIPVTLSGRDWTLFVESRPNIVHAGDGMQSLIVAFGGLTVDLLLFFVIASIGRQKRRTMKFARQITKDLTENNQLTRSILQQASEAIITVDQQGQIDLFNEAAEDMFGICAQLAAGSSFDKLLDRMDWQKLLELADIAALENQELIIKGLRHAGEPFPCRIALGRVTATGQLNYIIIVTDETARVEAAKKIAEVNQQLIDASHKSGMSQVTTGVLHNVGNVLNSVNVSTDVLLGTLSKSRAPHLRKMAEIFGEHSANLAEFLTNDPRGKSFTDYLEQATLKLSQDHEGMTKELHLLHTHVQHIIEIIRVQQGQACGQLLEREEKVNELMEDAMKINMSKNQQYEIEIIRDFDDCPCITSDRHKILQILVNLIKNAQEAVRKVDDRKRVIKLKTEHVADECIQMIIEDNGIGISTESLVKVLQFGYTTKHGGHGFGLHSCLIAAKQVGGELSVESDGEGCGARFTLTLPVSLADAAVQDSGLRTAAIATR